MTSKDKAKIIFQVRKEYNETGDLEFYKTLHGEPRYIAELETMKIIEEELKSAGI